MVIGAGLILGPILGGWLTQFGWRTVFWFNVPIGLVGTFAAALALTEQTDRRGALHLDWLGSAIYLVGLTGLVVALAFGGIFGWTTWWVIGGAVLFVLALPLFFFVERHAEEPLLDLDLFRIRLFAMGNLSGLLNGVARNSVLFLLVFYLQGAQGEDPVEAGIRLAPLAVGLLVLSPISGALADRYGSRALATVGMLITGVGLLGLTTLQLDTPYWQLALWQLVIGAGSGLFNSPNTSAVMGAVPPAQRGVGSGARMMLQNTGFIVSIAIAIGLVTTAMDPDALLQIFSGSTSGPSGISMVPFVSALHLAFWAGVGASLLGAAVSYARGSHQPHVIAGGPARPGATGSTSA
jgi:MFS family permease